MKRYTYGAPGNDTLDQFARDVVEDVRVEGNYTFDPITITILLAILSGIISHYVEKCLNYVDGSVSGIDGIRKPNMVQRVGLKWAIDREFVRQAPDLRSLYSEPMYRKLLDRTASVPNGVVEAAVNGLRHS